MCNLCLILYLECVRYSMVEFYDLKFNRNLVLKQWSMRSLFLLDVSVSFKAGLISSVGVFFT